MNNIIQYAKTEGQRSFAQKPFCDVDSLILAKLSYLNFDGFVPGPSPTSRPVSIGDLAGRPDLYRLFSTDYEPIQSRSLFDALADSRRFGSLNFNYYINKLEPQRELQFAAITCLLEDGSAYLSYRGTDNSIVGWKEDFNMAFLNAVPAQQEGVRYGEAVASFLDRPLRLGGHSKGGNVAVYTAMKGSTALQNRIIQAYSMDGPGFRAQVLRDGAYQRVKAQICKVLPQASVIGMLLQHQEHYSIVESDRIWIFQHDPLSWVVENGSFRYVEEFGPGAAYTNTVIAQWLETLDDGQRETFINTIYQLIKATGAATFQDLTEDWKASALAMLYASKDIDGQTKKFVLTTIGSLLSIAAKTITGQKN